MISLTSIGQEKRILNRVKNSSIIRTIQIYLPVRTILMDDNSVHIHRDDSINLTKDFSSPQPTSSTYYSYQHIHHPPITYPNNSFNVYDQLINNINTYNGKQFYINLILLVFFLSIIWVLEQPSVSTTDLSPSKESMNRNISQPYDCQINWGKRKMK